MNTAQILTRLNKLETDLVEINKIADTQQIHQIIEIMEKYNRHPEILAYLKWSVGFLLGIALIGLIGVILTISLCTHL